MNVRESMKIFHQKTRNKKKNAKLFYRSVCVVFFFYLFLLFFYRDINTDTEVINFL